MSLRRWAIDHRQHRGRQGLRKFLKRQQVRFERLERKHDLECDTKRRYRGWSS